MIEVSTFSSRDFWPALNSSRTLHFSLLTSKNNRNSILWIDRGNVADSDAEDPRWAPCRRLVSVGERNLELWGRNEKMNAQVDATDGSFARA